MRSIQELKENIKSFHESSHSQDIFVILLIILVALASFGLGRLSVATQRTPEIAIEYPPFVTETDLTDTEAYKPRGSYVASKNGTKYYTLDCSGVNRIKEENKVYFDTTDEAEARGYDPAANCF